MLLPERMSRIVVAGNKSRIDEAIDVLYEIKAIHLIDHATGQDEGFSIGAPRPYTGKTSERLLSLRAAEKELGIDPEKDELDEPVSVKEVRAKISSNRVESIVEDVYKVLDRKNAILQKLADETARMDDLSAVATIPVPLELYKGYASLAALVGTVKGDPTGSLSVIKDSELFVSGGDKKGERRVMALFVRKSEREDALRILAGSEFTEMPVPDGTGSASEAVAAAGANITALKAELAETEKELALLKEKHANDIIALDEELSIEEMKGSTPLHIATSEFSFVIDAWVPTGKVSGIVAQLEKELGSNVYIEVQEDRTRDLHEVDHAEDRFKVTPTKMNNGNYAKHFEYPVKLVDVPKYQEIDPTIVLSIFFPLFFGLMVGDVGYAIPFIVLGAYGLKTAKNKDFRAIATVLFFGGLWAFIFGFFLFGEMFGMHFYGDFDGTSHTWASLLGLTYPEWFVNIFPDHGHGLSKLHQVPMLLKVSVYIGVMHILLGFIIGFINVKMQHGAKEAFMEKGGWIMTFVGLVILCWAITDAMIQGNDMNIPILAIGLVLLIAGVVVAIKKEGGIAALEVPSLFGNILSYTRITAIGVGKAGMALAFNFISITLIGAGLGGIAGIVIGLLLFSFLHLVVWTLAILSAGLHALRLHYVEMMSRFFAGGGKEYEPLGITRKNTKIVETEV